jgi:hypothetical protein
MANRAAKPKKARRLCPLGPAHYAAISNGPHGARGVTDNHRRAEVDESNAAVYHVNGQTAEPTFSTTLGIGRTSQLQRRNRCAYRKLVSANGRTRQLEAGSSPATPSLIYPAAAPLPVVDAVTGCES